MPALAPAVEFVDLPPTGRSFTAARRVRLGDVDARARLRLDAIARILQDVATDDAADADLGDSYGWLVRRTMIEVRRSARLGESLEVTTFCSGYGRSWAERRTVIRGALGGDVDAVSLWVSIDPGTGRPAALDQRFLDVYGESAAGRRVGPRLRLPSPTGRATDEGLWHIRVADIDPYGHANNAAQWAAVEEHRGSVESRRGLAEIEFVSPIEPSIPVHRLADDSDGWLVTDRGELRTAFRFTPAD